MSHAMLPALRVKEAAEKALQEVDPKAPGFHELRETEQLRWFSGLIGLCRAVLADPKGDHDIAVEANEFRWIMKHYDFTDPRLIAHHELPSTAR